MVPVISAAAIPFYWDSCRYQWKEPRCPSLPCRDKPLGLFGGGREAMWCCLWDRVCICCWFNCCRLLFFMIWLSWMLWRWNWDSFLFHRHRSRNLLRQGCYLLRHHSKQLFHPSAQTLLTVSSSDLVILVDLHSECFLRSVVPSGCTLWRVCRKDSFLMQVGPVVLSDVVPSFRNTCHKYYTNQCDKPDPGTSHRNTGIQQNPHRFCMISPSMA